MTDGNGEALLAGDGDGGSLSLTQQSTRGFVWNLAATLATQGVTFATQIVLAWLLVEEDFGLVAMAISVSTFLGLIRQNGLRQVLVQRHASFAHWSPPAVWISVALGAIGGVAMLAAAPLAADFFDSPEVSGLVRVLAISAFLHPLGAVPMARLEGQLRFRFVSILSMAHVVAISVLSVVFAWQGLGAYSFVIPVPIVVAAETAVAWWAARPPVDLRLHLDRWRSLLADSFTLMVAGAILIFTWQGDYLVLGRFHDDAAVGIYYFAFALSMRTMFLLSGNVARVLFPALSSIQDDQARQTRAFLRAARLLAAVGVFASLLLAGLADPVVRLLFADRWVPAIPILQVLSLGMALRVVGSPAGSLMVSQGRYRTILILNVIYTLTFMVAVTLGAFYGDELTVAAAASGYFALMGPIHMYVAVRPAGHSVREVASLFGRPIATAGLAVGAGWLAARTIASATAASQLLAATVTVVVSVPIYLVLVRAVTPAVWREGLDTTRDLLRRVRPASRLAERV